MLLLLSLLLLTLPPIGKAHIMPLKQPLATNPLPLTNNTQPSPIQPRDTWIAACNAPSNDFHIPLENNAKLTSFAPFHDNAVKLCSEMCNSGKGCYWFQATQDFWTPSGNGGTVHQRIYCSTTDVAKTVIGFDPTFCRNSFLLVLDQCECAAALVGVFV